MSVKLVDIVLLLPSTLFLADLDTISHPLEWNSTVTV